MRKVHRVDTNKFYVEDVLLQDNEPTPLDCVNIPLPQGIFLPAKFENGVWTSTLSEADKQALMNPETEPTQLDLMQKAIDDLIFGGM
jgi:hypothetical protein